ncbi:MAG: RagB/SusD family nutrient uptake outer membrane protein, partial [Gemmatimonadetes bacterium]
PENILVVKNLNQPGLGLNFVMRALHYNQLTPTPWNGFAALAETYRAFDADDQRREIFLEGPQVNLDSGEAAFDRYGNPLVFTVDIIDETNAGEGEGTRIMKWPPDPNRAGPDNGNDFAYFRLGDILLIKAEALNELYPGSGEALALLNALRARVFEPDKPLTTVDRDVILRERLLELTAEAKRRQDLIRHGRYTQAWSFKQAGGPHLILMPIPQSQLDANPMLVQNPGY